ncbi:MAG: hypothetical protein WCS34_02325 [Bacteroidales bacterium]
MKKIIFFTVILFALTSINTQAQNYNQAFGFRTNFNGYITFQYRVSAGANNFFNLEANFKDDYDDDYGFGTSVSADYLWSWNVGPQGLVFYAGTGAYAGFINKKYKYTSDESKINIGVRGYAEIEYRFDNSPIALSLTIIPTIDFTPEVRLPYQSYGGLGIKYCF